MSLEVGPVEVYVVKFPGSQFNGEIAPALAEAVAQGDIRVLDFAFIVRSSDDDYELVELEEIEDDTVSDLGMDGGTVMGLFSDEDVDGIAEQLEVGSSALAIAFEHTWAARLATAVRDSAGEVIYNERIPAGVVAAAIEAALVDLEDAALEEAALGAVLADAADEDALLEEALLADAADGEVATTVISSDTDA